MASYKDTAKEIVQAIGGKENIINAWHCVTRLRFNLKEKENIPIQKIKKMPGVMGAQFSGDQFQVIIGNTVSDVFAEVENIVGSGSSKGSSKSDEGILSKVFDAIAGIFTPIVPALAGTGLLKGFLALAVIVGVLKPTSQTYLLIYGLADSVLYFLPFLLAVTTAKKFKTNEFLAIALAGAMIHPTYLMEAQKAMQVTLSGGTADVWKMFGALPVPLVTYTSSVIPIIFSVILLKYVFDWVKKWVPKCLSLMFAPMIALLIVYTVAMVVIGPIGTYAGNFMSGGISLLFEKTGPLAGVILGATYPLIIMTGMHYSFAPIGLNNFAKYGYEHMTSPINAVTNVAQSGAAFAVAFKTKNTSMRQIAISSGISAIIGITEPAMYGVNLKMKRPFYGAMAGGALAGGLAIMMGVKNYGGGGMPGLLSIPGYVHITDRFNVMWFIAALALSWFASFIITIILGFEDELEEENITEEKTKNVDIISNANEKNRIFAPVTGTIVPLKDVSDDIFAQEIIGKGIAILPTKNEIYAPISGNVKIFPESKHAIGIEGDNGVEVLVHIGIDTVQLNGQGFDLKLDKDTRIEKGQLLGTVDFEMIKSKQIDTTTMIVVTNTMDYKDISSVHEEGEILKDEELLYIV